MVLETWCLGMNDRYVYTLLSWHLLFPVEQMVLIRFFLFYFSVQQLPPVQSP